MEERIEGWEQREEKVNNVCGVSIRLYNSGPPLAATMLHPLGQIIISLPSAAAKVWMENFPHRKNELSTRVECLT
jgi:hypothetical protein